VSEQARLQARNPQQSCLVQAPAGSGKTELLTQRILALLAIVDEPEEILALTFTRKAAAEMHARVTQALAMEKPDAGQLHKMETWKLAQTALKRSGEREWHLEQHPARLKLMTLDSLTHTLAKQLPLLSGLGEMPKPADNLFPVYREAAEAALNQLIRSDEQGAEHLLLHLDHQAVVLVGLVADMLAKREQWLDIVVAHARDMDGLRAMLESGLRNIMEEQLEQCEAMIPLEIRMELPGLLAFAGENRGDDELLGLRSWPEPQLDQLGRWQLIAGELMSSGAFRKPGGINARRGFPASKEFALQKDRFKQILGQLVDIRGLEEAMAELQKLPEQSAFNENQWRLMQDLFSLLILSAHQLQMTFSRSGEADFIEIALRALQALEGEQGAPSDLLLKLDYRIHHILVDEFQDTSLLQMRLLQNLTEGWQSGDGKHRTLFMVGDPMQSIYRFRKAEVGLFLQAAANMAGLPVVNALQLERNFRSSPKIVSWVNQAFAAIFPDEQDVVRGAVAHAEAVAALDHDGVVQLHLQRGRSDQLEAKRITQLVQQERLKCSANGKPQSIAILARSRKHLHAIMPALTDAGIAFRATNILPLNSRAEVRLLRALLRALLHPADRESWVALLRSTCCGLNTQGLFSLLAGDGRAVWQILSDENKLKNIDVEVTDRISAFRIALAPCMQVSSRVSARTLLESAWQRLSMPGVLAQAETQNIMVCLDLVESLEQGGRIDFSLFDERLEKLYATPDSSNAAAQVELMTMHGSKGLQWDVVILPGLGKAANSNDSPLLAFTDVPIAGGAQPLLAIRAATRSEDALFKLVNGLEKSKYNHELARLLYVACTRAESGLYMFAHLSEKTEKAASASLLNLLISRGHEAGCFDAELLFVDQDEHEQPRDRKRLMRMKQMPVPDWIDMETDADLEVEYLWAGPEAAPVGNVVHGLLQRVAECGIESWETSHSRELILRLLIDEGLSGTMLDRAIIRCERALSHALNSERGRWILSSRHADAKCEWALSLKQDGFVSHHIIDRSFVDADGVRWIIDYKTASHEGGDLEGFLAEELTRHTPQLHRYMSILKRVDPDRVVKCALYFPMLDAWKELIPEG